MDEQKSFFTSYSQKKKTECRPDPEDNSFKICKETTEYYKDNKHHKDVKEYREKNNKINLFRNIDREIEDLVNNNFPFMNQRIDDFNDVKKAFDQFAPMGAFFNHIQNGQKPQEKQEKFRNFSKNDNDIYES